MGSSESMNLNLSILMLKYIKGNIIIGLFTVILNNNVGSLLVLSRQSLNTIDQLTAVICLSHCVICLSLHTFVEWSIGILFGVLMYI